MTPIERAHTIIENSHHGVNVHHLAEGMAYAYLDLEKRLAAAMEFINFIKGQNVGSDI